MLRMGSTDSSHSLYFLPRMQRMQGTLRIVRAVSVGLEEIARFFRPNLQEPIHATVRRTLATVQTKLVDSCTRKRSAASGKLRKQYVNSTTDR